MNNHLDLLTWDNGEAEDLNRFYGERGEYVQAGGGMINHIESIGGADSLPGGNAFMSMRFAEQIVNNAEDDKMNSDPSTNHMERKLRDVLQLKQGLDADLPEDKILDLMKSNGLENASTQSLFSIVNRILSDISERKGRELTHGVASFLRNIVQLIHWRFSNQAETLKSQSATFKAREIKYRTQICALEALAIGTNEENEVVGAHLQHLKFETAKVAEKKQIEEKDLERLKKEKVHSDIEISVLKQELEAAKNMHEWHCSKLVEEANEGRIKSEKRIKELECLLTNSRMQVEELDAFTKSKSQKWKDKELGYKCFIDDLCQAIQEMRAAFGATKQEVLKTKRRYSEEFNYLGNKLKGLVEAASNYHAVLTENRKLYNEVQDLKGNIRVYCRVRPFLPGQNQKHTTVEYIGENGEIMVANPLKQGKDSRRFFKFNKVFVPTATQEEVFVDTRPLIRSVLDGYNVCIFAYGQTGSGKTHTMSGPSLSLKEDWGVNYRALHDLFQISESRRSSICYEVGVQMVEIYNEQVRDLLSTNGSQKRLGIWNTTQPNGLTVPDASMHPVNSMQDVLELMNVGLHNRAVGSTALNERSSRSHSILTIHVRGMDLETNTILRGCLHLVDLAGSERVEKSEATGDRLREAQHINRSLSALGDVISALALKSQHVPYRNSKLTQVLQSSLGGQAKTLMFVHLNPDITSYSETVSTLKFAERVSGVELGAARSNKEGKDIRGLMDQVAALKDTIATRDEEIEQLRYREASLNNHGISSLRSGSPSPRRHSVRSPPLSTRMPEARGFGHRAASDADNEHSDKHSDGSQQSLDEFRSHNLSTLVLNLRENDVNPGVTEDIELLGIEDADAQERLSDISDGDLSMGTETEGSMGSVVEYTLFPEAAKPSDGTSKSPSETTPTKNNTLTEKVPVETRERPSALPKLLKPPQAPQKQLHSKASRLSLNRSSSKPSSSARKTTAGSSSPAKPFKRW